jgi:hypothetical protein
MKAPLLTLLGTSTLAADLEAVPLTTRGIVPAAFTRQQMQTHRLKLK